MGGEGREAWPTRSGPTAAAGLPTCSGWTAAAAYSLLESKVGDGPVHARLAHACARHCLVQVLVHVLEPAAATDGAGHAPAVHKIHLWCGQRVCRHRAGQAKSNASSDWKGVERLAAQQEQQLAELQLAELQLVAAAAARRWRQALNIPPTL